MRKHSIGGKRILVWIVGLLLIINQSVFLSESMVYGLTGETAEKSRSLKGMIRG